MDDAAVLERETFRNTRILDTRQITMDLRALAFAEAGGKSWLLTSGRDLLCLTSNEMAYWNGNRWHNARVSNTSEDYIQPKKGLEPLFSKHSASHLQVKNM